LYVFVDGPKSEHDELKVKEVVNYVKGINGFKGVIVKRSDRNCGLAYSVITGVSEIIEKSERVIVLEDDMLVTQDFLAYMNDALNIYKNNKLIASVSGYSFDPVIPKEYTEDVFLSKRASSWGWGTWKDCWQAVDWELRDFDSFINDSQLLEKFKLGGSDLLPMIVKYRKGVIDSWAIRWSYHHFKNEQYCLVPRLSKVQNIGTDGSGTNFVNVNDRYAVNFGEKEITFPISPKPNVKILQSFKKVYTPSLYRRILNYFQYQVW